MSELAVQSLELPMWNLDYLTVENIVSSFLEDNDIAYMAIREDDRHIAGMSQSKFIGNTFDDFRMASGFITTERSILYNGSVIGEVQLAISRARVQSDLATNIAVLVAVSVMILLAILTTSRLITRRYITRRLLELEHAATAIASGDLKADIGTDFKVGADDEIGRLAQNLETMRDAIKQLVEDLRASKEELEQHNAKLGQMVQERTSELEQATNTAQVAQRLAEEANRAKSDFLSSMSHELRTPLNAIIGFTEYVLESDEEPVTEDQRESLSQVVKAGRHLLVLIDDVLDLSKVEADAISLSLEAVDLREVADECVSLLSAFAASKNVEIDNQLTAQALPPVKADRNRVKQVLLNLLSNAIKYNKDPGRVQILQGAAAPGMLRIAVRDDGLGIADDRLADLFNPFDRLGAENSAIEGSGIGLTITKSLVDRMGGKISVDSVTGKGSTFWLEMPISDSPVKPRIEPEACGSQDTTDIEGLVLYIEDNPANLELVRRITTRRPGIDFISAATGKTGIERARAEIPDVILLDINLPDLGGYQVLEALRVAPETRHIPVIALTAAATDADIARGRAAGFFSYLTKPFAARRLMATIGQALRPVAST